MASGSEDIRLRVCDTTAGALLATAAEVADTSRKRRVGLLKHESMPEGYGLWIVPCEAIHTFGMRFPIDIVFLSKQREVLKLREDLRPGRIAFCLRAHSVLELPAGVIRKAGTRVGNQLEFTRV